MSNEIVVQSEKTSLVTKFAERYGVDGDKVLNTLKQTCFKQRDREVTNEQMMALLIVADQYQLNPFTKEIYAFPDKNSGIVPVVGIDGWLRIINSHPQFDGMEFNQSEKMVTMKGGKPAPEWMECTIYRKDRKQPTIIREYLDEVYQEPRKGFNGPWQTHTKRFMRHKTAIQAGRVSFGFGGIYDPDEAERIVDVTPGRCETNDYHENKQTYSQESFDTNFPKWEKAIELGKKTADEIISLVSTKAQLTDEQANMIKAVAAPIDAEVTA